MYRRQGDPDIRYGGEQAPVSGGVAPERQSQPRDRVRGRLCPKRHNLRSGRGDIHLTGRRIRVCLSRHRRDPDGVAAGQGGFARR